MDEYEDLADWISFLLNVYSNNGIKLIFNNYQYFSTYLKPNFDLDEHKKERRENNFS
jgi:hypothetical protein